MLFFKLLCHSSYRFFFVKTDFKLLAEILFIYSVSNVILLKNGKLIASLNSNLVNLVEYQVAANCLFKSDNQTTLNTEQGSEIPEWPIGLSH